MDCFRLLDQILGEQAAEGQRGNRRIQDTLSQIWLIGHWSRPWAKASYEAPAPSASPHYLAKRAASSDAILVQVVRNLRLLSPELFQIIVGHCPESPLWRYAIVSTRLSGLFRNLKDSKMEKLSLIDLFGWSRDGNRNFCANLQDCAFQDRDSPKFVRFTLDDNGIKTVEFLNCRSEAPPGESQVEGKWYIIEDFARLTGFHFQSKVQVLLPYRYSVANFRRVVFYIYKTGMCKTVTDYGTVLRHQAYTSPNLPDIPIHRHCGYVASHSIHILQA